ncbi:MAG: hypothetical protein ABJJ53_13755 [Sulfitobacter sp.]
MTISAEQSFVPTPAIGAAHTLNGNRLMVRIGMRIGAVTMTMVAMLIWIAPGAGWETDMIVFKMMVCLSALLAAVWFGEASLPPVPPTVELDVEASELRLIREGAPKDARVLERCAFEDLHMVELAGKHITFWGRGNRLLAEVTLSNAILHGALLDALRVAGKIA